MRKFNFLGEAMKYSFVNTPLYGNTDITKGCVFSDGSAGDGICVDLSKYAVLPGFADVHVHLREPGFSYKETIASGTRACARGGYTQVCSMPNLNPVPDSMENLKLQLDIIEKDACIAVQPYGAITVGEKGETLAELEAMAPYVCGFSDDGRGVADENLMRAAMEKAKALNKMIVAHCEDMALVNGGYIHDGDYAKAHGHKGICSASEYEPIARDLKLAEEIGVRYHVCHISTKESVALIREAKARGVDVTCETGPHYLTLCDADLQEEGRFKMNPPLRSAEDRDALIEGILDGTIDMIATDHAPHAAEEKAKGLAGSAMGVVGIETAFPVMYTAFVKSGKMTLEKLLDLMVYTPRRRFGFKENGFSIWDLDAKYTVDPAEFVSLGKSTPFTGREVYGKCLMTVMGDKVVWVDEELKK